MKRTKWLVLALLAGLLPAIALAQRLDGIAATALWRERRGRWVLAGAAIAALLSLPIVNLAAPLVAASFMLHLVTEASGLAASSERNRSKT